MRTRQIGPISVPYSVGHIWSYDPDKGEYVPRSKVPDTYGHVHEVCTDTKNPGPPYRSGGPFSVRKSTNTATGQRVEKLDLPNNPLRYYFSGTLYPAWDLAIQPLKPVYTGSEYGAEAWAKAAPGRPGLDIAQAIAELKDMPKLIESLYKTVGRAAREWHHVPNKGGDAYLAYQFGILPLVSDIKALYNTYKNQEAILRQIIRDNGRPIRRRRKLISTSSSTTESSSVLGFHGITLRMSNARTFKIVSTSKDVWFEGRFRYYIPDIGSVEWERRAIRALYGGIPSIRTLWELTPWSWLIDWYVDVGAVLGNLSDHLAEGLYADYAYLMATSREVTTLVASADCYNVSSGERVPVYCSRTRTVETKSRIVASRFGFGLTSDDFTNYQNGIATAFAAKAMR